MRSFLFYFSPLILLILIPLLFYFFSFNDHFVIYFQNSNDVINTLLAKNYAILLLFFILYIFLSVVLNFPGGSFRAIIAGYIFGIYIGSAIILLITTLASFLLFLIYKKNPFLDKKFANSAKYIRFIKDDFIFLIFIRILPIIPFFLQNFLIAKLKISNGRYLLTTLIGIIPTNLTYLILGNQLNDFGVITNFEIYTILGSSKILILVILCLILYVSMKFFFHKKIIFNNDKSS